MSTKSDHRPAPKNVREPAADATLPNVAIVGRPNVGKSALFNRLIGRQTAIVHDQPGVTRDRLSAICTAGARPFTLWDTGGIGGAGESELTEQVHRTVDAAVQESDLLLFLVDAQEGLSPIDQDLARRLRKIDRPVILVVNKIDHEKHDPLAADFDSLGFDRSVSVSAAHGRGVAELRDTIDQVLPPGAAPSAWNRPLARERFSELADDHWPSPKEVREQVANATRIAIVGRPNVGKSSLINSITRSERAIVSELPGTTRDAIDISYRQGSDEFVFIDTAGIRRRARHSSSVEVFSVMRAERSIRRADLCVLTIDITSGVTAQDKKIGGLIQEAGKAAIILVNKFDLLRGQGSARRVIEQVVNEAKQRLFFLDYAPALVASAATGEHVEKLFSLIKKIARGGKHQIGTGRLNRLLRAAVAANPPPMVAGRRLKLFYATQTKAAAEERPLEGPEFVLFVNDPKLLGQTYRRYLENRIREEEPYAGLPIVLTLRPRSEKVHRASRSRTKK